MPTTMQVLAEVLEHPTAHLYQDNDDRQARLGPAISITFGIAISCPIWAIVGWTLMH